MTNHRSMQLAARCLGRVGLASTTIGAALFAVLALGAGCANVAPAPDARAATARTAYAESPVEWRSEARACADAGKRARRAAQRSCEVTSVSIPRAGCTCRPSAVTAGHWRCTAAATYTCASDAMVAGGPDTPRP